jgi:hypothetical protein
VWGIYTLKKVTSNTRKTELIPNHIDAPFWRSRLYIRLLRQGSRDPRAGQTFVAWTCQFISSVGGAVYDNYTCIPPTLYTRRGSRDISEIPPWHPYFTKMVQLSERRGLCPAVDCSRLMMMMIMMRNIADVTGVKPIAVYSQSISDVSAVNTLVVLYDIHHIHERKGAVLFFCSIPYTTRDDENYYLT